MKCLALVFVTLLATCDYQPPKRARYTVMRAEMGLGEYAVEVSDAQYVAADGNCITFWWEGQSKEQPSGIACGKVWVRSNKQ